MSLDNVELELVNTVEKASAFMTWLGERRSVLAFDTETGGLEPEKCDLRLVQFGDERYGWAIPWDHWGGVALEALEKYEGELVGHNAGFDLRFLELHGNIRMKRENIHDTMTMCHILNPNAPKGLKPNAARLVDSKAAYASRVLDEAMTQQKWTWATVPIDFEPYWAYGALDTVLTAHLHSKLRPQIEQSFHDVYELERACCWVLRDMERRGMRVDTAYAQQTSAQLRKFSAQVYNWCKETYSVSPGSNMNVAKVLESLGVGLIERTATGAYKLDEDVILSILGVGDLDDANPSSMNEAQTLAYNILKRRKAEKICSTYLDALTENADAEGRVHCSINQLGARTGRMSIEAPALQVLTRGTVVRDCFIPREGHVLLSADYDAVEYRLLAHFAQDQTLLEAIGADVDIHTAMARTMYSDPEMSKKDPRRQVMKGVNFAKLYGAGVEKIARTAGVSVPEAKKFLDDYDKTFSGVRDFQQTVSNVGAQRLKDEGTAYVKTPIGRLQPADDHRGYSLVNYLIQGTAADVLKEALLRLDAIGLSDAMLVPVHDEIIFEVHESDVEDAKQMIISAMQDDRWAVPLTVGVDGPLSRWGDKYR